jgi:hypothetical protein
MRQLDDIQADALSSAVQRGISAFVEFESSAGYVEQVADHHARRAGALVESQDFANAVYGLTVGCDYQTVLSLGALARRPGGVRLFEIVFCAKHYPFGTSARRQYACPRCDPDARQGVRGKRDARNVTTIEGNL